MIQYDQTVKGTFNGIQIIEYGMKNQELEVRFLNIGGCLTKVALAADDYAQNLVLNYQNVESYLENGCYLNAIIGRTANRIKNGTFTLNNKTYQLDINNGPNNLHGGAECLSDANFAIETIDSGYQLTATLPHQEVGFPGNLTATIDYILKGNQFIVAYSAITDQDTLANFTQHAYFNLAGNGSTTVDKHELQIKASHVAEIDKTQAFTTTWVPVEHTLFDFNQPTLIDPMNKEKTELFDLASGYDHLYLLSETEDVVTFKDLDSGRTLTVSTTAPAMQFYTGNFLTNELLFENNRQGEPRLGACFETHLVPFDIESQVLKSGETYRASTTFTFTK